MNQRDLGDYIRYGMGYGNGDGCASEDAESTFVLWNSQQVSVRLLAIFYFEQLVMDDAKRIAERPEEYAQVLAIMWNETKLGVRRRCEQLAIDTIDGMARLHRLGFERVEEYGKLRASDRRPLRQRHGLK